MKRTHLFNFFSASFLAFSLALLPVKTLAVGPQASASCVDGKITISMKAPANHKEWAIRVDDRSNTFQPTAMRPGDTLINDFKGEVFTRDGQSAELYNWWIHSIASNGTWSESTGGTLSCAPQAPTGLTASYDRPTVKITWKPVKGAVKYAIRVDNTVTPWTPDTMQEGDHLRNSFTETEFTHGASPDRKIVFWVHAIDKNGVWSEATWGNIVTK